MSSRSPRKFTILDGMILVAALACGFALRRVEAGAGQFVGAFGPDNWLGRNAQEPIHAVVPFLTAMTPAVVLMRLRRPRPRLRIVARQPGMAACCAAIIPLAMTLIELVRENWRLASSARDPFDWLASAFLLTEGGAMTGLWVLAAWAALAMGGRRRPERGWIDRLGRLVGLGWLLVLAVEILGHASGW